MVGWEGGPQRFLCEETSLIEELSKELNEERGSQAVIWWQRVLGTGWGAEYAKALRLKSGESPGFPEAEQR